MKRYCSIICEGDTPEIVYNKNENSADIPTQKSNDNNNFTDDEQLTNKCNELAEKLKQTLKFSKDDKTNELITNLKVTYDIHYKQTDSSNGEFKFSNGTLIGLAIEEIIANIIIGDKKTNVNAKQCKDGTPVKDMIIDDYHFQIKALQQSNIKNSMNDPIRDGVHAAIIAIYSFDKQTKQTVYLHQIQFFINSNDNKLQDLNKKKKLGNTSKDKLDITQRKADIIIQEIKKFYNM